MGAGREKPGLLRSSKRQGFALPFSNIKRKKYGCREWQTKASLHFEDCELADKSRDGVGLWRLGRLEVLCEK